LTPYRPIVCTFVLLGTVLLMPGRASAQDHHGKPTGPQGPAGPPGPGLNGRQEFQVTGPFIVPAGVSRLSVELYGGGGGGAVVHCNGGGGGGGGAYTSTILAVQEGQTLTISVGVSGRQWSCRNRYAASW
jgi:hypothetical protein